MFCNYMKGMENIEYMKLLSSIYFVLIIDVKLFVDINNNNNDNGYF